MKRNDKGRKLVALSTCAGLVLLSVSMLFRDESLTAVAVGMLGFCMWEIEGAKKEDALLYLLSGLLGAAAEMVAIRLGAWSYSVASMQMIPLWLPFAWGAAALYIKRLYLTVRVDE